MKKLMGIFCFIFLLLTVGCSSKNPYEETHITDLNPHYKIQQPTEPTFTKPLETWSLDELKTRYGELQNTFGLTPSQEYEMKLIDARLREMTSKEKTSITLNVN